MLLGGLMAWVSLAWLRMLDHPSSFQVKDVRSWQLRRWAGRVMSCIGIALALYGAWQ